MGAELGFKEQFGLAAGSNLLGTGLGLLTQNQVNKNNYKWSEKAAESSFQRQMEMYERQYKDKSPLNVVNQLEAAGLNKSLMFSSGAGGTGGAATGATAPQTQFSGSQAPTNGINLAVTMSQLEQMKAQTENIKADTAVKLEQAPKTFEEGKSVFIENTRKKYEDWYSKDTNKDESGIEKSERYGSYSINADSLRVEKIGQEIYNLIATTDKTTAEKLLTDKKVNGYLQELAMAQQNSDSQAIQAAAQKLAAEFNYGDYTNWKYWAQLGTNVIKIIK